MSDTEIKDPRHRDSRRAADAPGDKSFTSELMSGLRASARHTFSVPSLVTGLKSLFWILPLSVVIWVYAEQEDVDHENAFVTIVIHSPDPARVVRLVDPMDGRVSFDLTGTNGARQSVRDQLASGIPLTLDLPESLVSSTGQQRISAALLNDQDVFRNNGVTVSGMTPANLIIDVERVREVELDVQPAPGEVNFAVPPTFTPRKIHVTAPESVIDNAKTAGMLVAYAQLDVSHETPGPHDYTAIPVTIPFGDKSMKLTPATVSAHVEIKKADATIKMEAIPIWISYPVGFDEKYKANCDTSLPDVTLIGPEDKIRALANSELKAKAWFEASSALLPVDTEHEVHLHYDLPPDVHPSPADLNRVVTVKLTERHASE